MSFLFVTRGNTSIAAVAGLDTTADAEEAVGYHIPEERLAEYEIKETGRQEERDDDEKDERARENADQQDANVATYACAFVEADVDARHNGRGFDGEEEKNPTREG